MFFPPNNFKPGIQLNKSAEHFWLGYIYKHIYVLSSAQHVKKEIEHIFFSCVRKVWHSISMVLPLQILLLG